MHQNICDLQLRQQERLLAKFNELFTKQHTHYVGKGEGMLVAVLFLLEGVWLLQSPLPHIALVTIYIVYMLRATTQSQFQVFTIRWFIAGKALTSPHLWYFVNSNITVEQLRMAFLLLCLQTIATVIKFKLTNNKIIVLSLVIMQELILSFWHFRKIDGITIVAVIGTFLNIWLMYSRQQKHQEDHEQKIKEFDCEAKRLKNETEQTVKSRFISDQQQSRQEELLKKLRLLKYQKLLSKSEEVIEQESLKKQLSSPSRILTLRNLPEDEDKYSIEEIDEPHKRSPTRRQRMNSISPQSPAKTCGHTLSQNPLIKDQVREFDDFLTLDELDDLLKIVSGRKEHLWLPQFLRSNKNIDPDTHDQESFSPEAKSFILNHFTECEFNFQQSQSEFNSHIEEENLQGTGHQLDECENNFNFDFWELNDQSRFIIYSTFIFGKYNIHQVLKIKDNSIQIEFCHRIESFYMQNPYHNSTHAIDVTNSASFFLENGLKVSPFEQACLIISCLAHDVGHPGLNNGFMVASHSKQALIYNDLSVLESYHASLLFHVLRDEKANIIKHLNDVDFKGFRKYCLNLILDTDLQKHFPLLSKFKNFLALGCENPQDEQNKLLLLSISIKCADVGHGAKELNLHKLWSRRIIEEFFLQGDLEQQVHITVTPMCDRSQSVTKSQEGFLKAIVWPLFDAFAEYLKNPRFNEVCLNQINANIEYWQKQYSEEEQKGKKCPFFLDTNHIHIPTQNTNMMINLNW